VRRAVAEGVPGRAAGLRGLSWLDRVKVRSRRNGGAGFPPLGCAHSSRGKKAGAFAILRCAAGLTAAAGPGDLDS